MKSTGARIKSVSKWARSWSSTPLSIKWIRKRCASDVSLWQSLLFFRYCVCLEINVYFRWNQKKSVLFGTLSSTQQFEILLVVTWQRTADFFKRNVKLLFEWNCNAAGVWLHGSGVKSLLFYLVSWCKKAEKNDFNFLNFLRRKYWFLIFWI